MYTVSSVRHIVEQYHPKDGDYVQQVHLFLKELFAHHFNEYEKRTHLQNALELGHSLALLHLDGITVAVGMLHGVLRMNLTSPSAIKKRFGTKILHLLHCFTKMTKLMDLRLELHHSPAIIIRFLLSLTKDPRALFVLLLFRLHYLERHQRERKKHILDCAEATLSIYTMIASALNAWKVKGDLEEIAFKILYPEQSIRYTSLIEQAKTRHWHHVEKFKAKVIKELKSKGIEATLLMRVKHPYSLFEKVQRKKKEETYDIFGLRILTKDVLSCYIALGIIHSLLPCIPRKIKDYISVPKHNGYQSLHTVLEAPEGYFIEVQLRTEEMEEQSEFGHYAHLGYKSTLKQSEGARSVFQSLLSLAQHTVDQPLLSSVSHSSLPQDIIIYEEKKVLLVAPHSTVLDVIIGEEGQQAKHLSRVFCDGIIIPWDTPIKGGEFITVEMDVSREMRGEAEPMVHHHKSKEIIRQWSRMHDTPSPHQNIYERLYRIFVDPALKKKLRAIKDRQERMLLLEEELLAQSHFLYEQDNKHHYVLTFEFRSRSIETLTQVLPSLSKTSLVIKGIAHRTLGHDLILSVHVRFSEPKIVLEESLHLLQSFPTLSIHIPTS